MSKETKRLRYLYRINLLNARDPEGNKYIIAKLKRRLKKLEE